MSLNERSIKRYWETPRNRTVIQQSAFDNSRQMFHSMLCLREEDSNDYLQRYYEKVSGILDNDALAEKFKKFTPFPLPSNALVSKASDEWNKVYYAQDRVKMMKFKNEKNALDFEQYLERIGFPATVEQDLFTLVKQQLQSIAIVDMAALNPVRSEDEIEDQNYSAPMADDRIIKQLPVDPAIGANPYVYFVDVGKIHDVGVNADGSIDWVMFVRQDIDDSDSRQLVVIDDTSYQVYDIGSDAKDLIPLVNEGHELGYCPATFIWRDVIDPNNKVRRYNSVLEIVEDLDKYNMLTVFREHADLYASYPIVWRYIDACDDDDETEQLKGWLGPGHQVEVSTPLDSGRMSVPTGFVDMDSQLLKYIEDKLRKLEVKITKHLTGVDNEIQNEKAFNESQIRSQYETRHSVLRYWAENVQSVHKFLVDTIARLKYGDDFISSTIDYGMDYFLYDTVTATNEYQTAKEAGLPQTMLELIYQKVKQSLTRNNPNAAARVEILEYLEPYIHYDLSVINPISLDYELKTNFSKYIRRFELENGSILDFGKDLTLAKKIPKIQKTLYGYVEEHRKTNPPIQPLLGAGQGSNSDSTGQGGVGAISRAA